jgi:hypothetical protein
MNKDKFFIEYRVHFNSESMDADDDKDELGCGVCEKPVCSGDVNLVADQNVPKRALLRALDKIQAWIEFGVAMDEKCRTVKIFGQKLMLPEGTMGDLVSFAHDSGETVNAYLERKICARRDFTENHLREQAYKMEDILENHLREQVYKLEDFRLANEALNLSIQL